MNEVLGRVSRYETAQLRVTHIENYHALNAADMLSLEAVLPASTLAMLLGEEPRPTFHELEDGGFLLIVRGMNFSADDVAENMVSVRIVCQGETVYIAHRRQVRSLSETLADWPNYDNAQAFVLSLVERITSKIELHVFALEESVDDAEEKTLDEPSQKDRLHVMKNRRKIIELRKYLLPQREVLAQFSRSPLVVHDEDLRTQWSDRYHRTSRVCELLDALRERLGLIQEEISAVLNDKMNKNIYTLSIISAVFLPLGFVTGLLGINVGGVPGMDAPMAFWWVVVGSIVLAIVIWLILRRKQWI